MEAAHVPETCMSTYKTAWCQTLNTYHESLQSVTQDSLSLSFFAITIHILRQSGKMPAHTEYLQKYINGRIISRVLAVISS
jgi:hypothetical protein